jgi:phosphatidylserine/phosphatidylglycerophosphate/cardiolipin synthase-like enzyme
MKTGRLRAVLFVSGFLRTMVEPPRAVADCLYMFDSETHKKSRMEDAGGGMEAESVEFLLTAEEAYPALERLVISARRHVSVSMRIFDPATLLKSDEGKAIGRDWSALLTHKLREGVRFTIVITDFDPVARPELHRYSWECRAACLAAAEASGNPDLIDVDVHMHKAQVGWFHRIMFMPATRRKLRDECSRLAGLDKDACDHALGHMPKFRRMVRRQGHKLFPRLWPPAPLVPATHHQKMAVIDDEKLYIGGLDLNPRRYDDKAHDRAPEKTWHDVQAVVTGPVVKAAARHLAEFREVTAGDQAPAPFAGLLRTLSADVPGGRRLAPRELVSEIEEAHLRLIRTARDYIYIETQFLRSSPITDALVAAAEASPHVQLIVMLPAAPEDVAFERSDDMDARYGEQLQTNAVERLRDAFGERVFFGSPAQARRMETGHRDSHYGAPIIYIHAKVIVVDGRSVIVSSANLNGRSMRWDTEAGIEVSDPLLATSFFDRCLRHWFPEAAPRAAVVAKEWNDAAQANARRAPEERTHFVLPYAVEPAAEMGEPLPGVPEEMV